MCGSMKFLEGDQLVWASNTNAEKSPKQGGLRSLWYRGDGGKLPKMTGRTKKRDARGWVREL